MTTNQDRLREAATEAYELIRGELAYRGQPGCSAAGVAQRLKEALAIQPIPEAKPCKCNGSGYEYIGSWGRRVPCSDCGGKPPKPSKTAPAPAVLTADEAGAIHHLEKYQRQCDEDGTDVQVSREALDKTLSAFRRLLEHREGGRK